MINVRKTRQCPERDLITSGYNKDKEKSLITTGRLIQSIAYGVKMLLLVHCYKKSMFQNFPQKEIGFLWPGKTYWDSKKAVDQG